MKFSSKYETFEEWLKNFKGSSSYKQRIIKAHEKYPKASLSQLRGHARKKSKPVSKLKPLPVYKRSFFSLSKREQNTRIKALEVLNKVRKGCSLKEASKELHISYKTVIRHTNAFYKKNGKWIPNSYDRISRVMSIYENGKQVWIEINSSRTASKIGKYNSSVNQFLRTGNIDVLKPFKKPFKDANGQLHYFETDPDKLYDIESQKEEPEFFEIYKI